MEPDDDKVERALAELRQTLHANIKKYGRSVMGVFPRADDPRRKIGRAHV